MEKIICGTATLNYNCKTHAGGGKYWAHYLSQPKPGSGELLSDFLQYKDWEPCEESEEKIYISGPNLCIAEEFGFEYSMQLYKRIGNSGDTEYLIVYSPDKEEDKEKFGEWYDAGFPT